MCCGINNVSLFLIKGCFVVAVVVVVVVIVLVVLVVVVVAAVVSVLFSVLLLFCFLFSYPTVLFPLYCHDLRKSDNCCLNQTKSNFQ